MRLGSIFVILLLYVVANTGLSDVTQTGFVANFAELFAALMIVGRTCGGKYDDRIQGQTFLGAT